MHPNLADKLAASGKAPAPEALPEAKAQEGAAKKTGPNDGAKGGTPPSAAAKGGSGQPSAKQDKPAQAGNASDKRAPREEALGKPAQTDGVLADRAMTDSALTQGIHAVYRGDIERHLDLLRRAGMLGGLASGETEGGVESDPLAASEDAVLSDPLFPLAEQHKRTPVPQDESEVSRRIQMALSAK